MSVIFTLVIMLIPNQEVKADSFIYDGYEYDIDLILEEIESYNSDYTISNYPYITVYPDSGGFRLYLLSSLNNSCYDSDGNEYSDMVCTNSTDYFLKTNSTNNYISGSGGYVRYKYTASSDSAVIDLITDKETFNNNTSYAVLYQNYSLYDTSKDVLIPYEYDKFVYDDNEYSIFNILGIIANRNSSYNIYSYPYISIHYIKSSEGTGFNFYIFNSNNSYDSSGNLVDESAVKSDDYYLKLSDSSSLGYPVVDGSSGFTKFSYNYLNNTYSISYGSGLLVFPGSLTDTKSYYEENGTLDGFYDNRLIYNNFSVLNDIEGYDYFIPYYSFSESFISITQNELCDLDGNDMKNITIDFERIFDESYTYQYKTDFSDWIDITSYVKEAYQYGYYYYRFSTYYNTLVEARVLDSDGNVVATNSLDVDGLLDYNDGYVFRNSFSSSTHSDLKYITFQSNFNELNVSHKFRLQYLSNDKTLKNIPDFLNYTAYLVDINGVILDYEFSDYFTITYDEYKLYEEDYETYLDGVITQVKELPGYVYGFKIVFEFDNLNNYTINVFDNYNKSTIWDFIKDFLDGYTLIEFPSNYDTAIIRSKNYTNLSSSLIYMNVLFSSPEYGLNFYNYDFINKRQNYSYEISDVTIDYSMITFNVNESNNVFPVLFRNSDSDEVFIYLKDDCFIQFFNRETLESYIVGTDEDNFNKNNDLVIDDEFNNFIDDNFNFDNASFYEMFSDGFENFRNVIVEIFQNVTYFFQGLCLDLKYFYIVVFAFVLVIFLTRFLL